MSYLYKIILTKPPPYLYELMPSLQRSHPYPGCFKLCVAGNNFSVTRFYRLPLMDEINWTLLRVVNFTSNSIFGVNVWAGSEIYVFKVKSFLEVA